MTVERSSCSQRKSDAANSREAKLADSRGYRLLAGGVEDEDGSSNIEQGLTTVEERRF